MKQTIGQQIKKARLESGLTQTRLADLCRLNLRTIQRNIPHYYFENNPYF